MAPFAILQKIQSSDTEIPSFLFQALIQLRYIGQRPQMRCLSHTYKTTISMKESSAKLANFPAKI